MQKCLKTASLLFIMFASQHLSAQNADTLRKYYSTLANSPNESDKVLLEGKLYNLLKSNEENDWMTAQNFFYQLKKAAVVDSIAKAQKIKFPEGQLVRGDEVKLVYDETDPIKKEAAYKAWIKKFPPEKYGSDRIVYDYARNSVSTAYAKAGNVAKAIAYADMVETPVWKGEGWAGAATVLQKGGYLDEAALLFKKASDNSYKYLTTNRKDYGADFAGIGYVGYNSSLAEIYLQQKKYDLALKHIREAHDSSKTIRANVNANYANILLALGKEKEAFALIDETVKAGLANAAMKETLKKLYPKVKGGTAGFDEYMALVNSQLVEKIKKDMARQMIKLPAPGFTLQDVDGKAVSLAALKGKTVVVDFWATWCGPCKASFPAMRMAMDRYKNDPDVQFLFVHTWERDDNNPAKSAKKYVVDNKYPFEVLMDLKDPATGENKVVSSYNVTAIPTKFVIDGQGNIRFRFTGFSSGDDAAVEEVAAMIELARKS